MANKNFTYELKIDAEIKDLLAKTNQVKQSMQSIMNSGKAPGADKIFSSIEKAIDRLQQKASQPIESVAAFQNLQKDAITAQTQLKKLGGVIENLGNLSEADKIELLPEDFKKKVQDAQTAVASFTNAFAKAQTESEELTEAQKQLTKAQDALNKSNAKLSDAKERVKIDEESVKVAKEKKASLEKQVEALKKYQTTLAAYEKAGADKRVSGDHEKNAGKTAVKGMNLPAAKAAAQKIVGPDAIKSAEVFADKMAKLNEELSMARKMSTAAENSFARSTLALEKASSSSEQASQKVKNLEVAVDKANKEFAENKAKDTQAAYAALRAEAGRLGVDLTNIPLEYTEQNVEELNNALLLIKQQGLDQVAASTNVVSDNFQQMGDSAGILGDKMNIAKEEVVKLDETVSNTTALTQRIAQFVGLQGGIEIARSAMRNAISTIKELDAAMTEMAVVTDLGVGDYWDQLPEYAARANELGVSIKSAYESATLYYQQGLKTNEVVAMSNETLKMARIAGLSAEDATNKMTAALRGFNMELNETSAQRVSDVYSELAAITASDVNEISSAMTKTASIASSAGMEFETTAAFLSQIIETTRESAETAGTALKTVIARFQELKKDPAEIGEVDGEVVDANKIETALRSVGVALRDTSGQFRDLDDVFLELASKWQDLDTNTQRYIATIAAGSRQQSRFIAMMSDYARTTDLVTAANNSAGASQEQFEKTMDSLESKLNELKNAWDTFTMGIMDSDILKAGVDILTAIITALNKVSDWFGSFSGAAKIGMVVAALYLGDKALTVFNKSLKEGKGIFASFGATGKAAVDSIQKKFITLKKLFTSKLNIKIGSEDLYKATIASKGYEQATKDLKKIEMERTTVAKAGNLTDAESAKYSMLAKEATERQNEAEKELMTTMGLSAIQMNSVQALEAMGIATGNALILTKAGITTENIAQLASLTGLTTAQIGNQLAEKLSNASGLKLLATKLALTVSNWAQTASEKAKTGSIWGNITATIAQTMANWGLQASMWPILVIGLLIIAALAVLIGIALLLVAAFKKIKANSPEGKLKAAEGAAEAAGEAAEAASEAYDNLAESFDNLADKYDALEELTQGTREWRDAVKEINSEILELVNNYPELAKFVKNEGGVLTIDIDSAEVQDVLTDYGNRAILAQTAEVASKISVAQAKNVVEYKALSNKATAGSEGAILTEKILGAAALAGAVTTGIATAGIGTAELGMAGTLALAHAHEKEKENKANTEKLSKALADGLVMQDEYGNWIAKEGEEAAQAFEEIGLTADAAESFANALGDNAEELRDYGLAVKQRAEQEEALYDAMAMSAVQMVNTVGMLDEEIQQINNAATQEYIKFFEEEAQEKLAELLDDKSKKEGKDYLEERAKEIYGTEDIKVKNNKVIIGTGDDAKEISREEFEKQLASTQGVDKAAKALENLPDAITNLSKKIGSETGKALERSYMKKEAGAMTKADLEALQMSEGDLYAAFENLGDEDKASFGDFETFKKHIEDTIEIGNKAFETATKSLEKMGATIELNGKQFTADAAKGYAEQLEYIMASSGQKGVDAVNDALNKLTADMDTDDFNKFMGQLNAMDWKNMEDWENLPKLLEELDITLPNVEVEAFTNEMSKLAGAVKKVDLEVLNEQILTLQGLSKNLKAGERAVSSSDYEALIKADPKLASQFQQNLDGDYVFLDSIEKLTEAIDKNTDALLGQAVDQLQSKVDAGQLLKEMSTWQFSDGSSGDINKWRKWEDDGLATNVDGFLRLFIEQANSQGIDLSKTDIKGLSNDLDIEALMKNETLLEEVMDGLVTLFGELGTNTELLSAKITNSLGLIYQNRDATENSYEASIYRTKLAATGVLNENEQNIMDASTGAITAQAEASGISVVDIDKYKKAISGLKQLQNDLADQKITLDQFKDSYAALAKEAEKFEKQVSNKTNFRNMNTQLEGTISSMGELTEKFDTLKDKSEKIETVGKMVEDLGISVNTANYEQISNLVKQITEGGENAYEAFQQLMQMSGESFGLTLEDLALMTSEKWNDTTNQMSETMQAFADRMVAIGSAMWKELGDGSKEFAWATKNNLADAAEAAGTVVEMWENPYDELYNLNQSLNATIRERERLERSYNRALKDSSTSAQELANITGKQLASLKEEAILQKDIAQQSLKNIAQKRAENSQYEGLYSVDYDTGRIQVDWKQAEAMGWNTDEGSEFEEFISYLEEQTEAALDAQDAIDDISDSVDEIEQRGKDATSEIYDQVKEGLVKQYENQITELENINNSIQEASADMISKMQEQIDDARKARDKEKTQSQINDKQTRLAYLKADSSGANALEIASLEKEISDAQESYTDSLIDDAIEKLQEDNEKAAEQRQEQIELQKSQLEAYVESGKIWEDVQRITNEGFAQVARGVPFADTEAGHLADLAADLKTVNPIRKQETLNALEESAKLASIYGGFAEIAGNPAGTLGEIITALKETLADLRDESDNPPPKVPTNNPSKDTDEDDGNLGDDQQPPKEEPTTEPEAKPSTQEPSTPTPQPEAKPTIPDDSNNKPSQSYVSRTAWTSYEKAVKDGFSNIMTKSEFLRSSNKKYEVYEEYLDAMYDKYKGSSLEGVAAKEGLLDNKLNTNQLDKNKNNNFTWELGSQKYKLTAKGPADAEVSQIASARQVPEMALLKFNNTFYAYKNGKAYPITGDFDDRWITYKKYASGGLADFTGPAWLDGTKSKPEIVLNQTDSANFMQLRDILADILNGSSTTSQENGGKGDNYFDIEISVESLGDDYDVEQLADKIRGMIYDDATYRNVNTINSIR